ncbi:MAG: hypothetical protein IT315_03295, partial [Anaerolineales bacterium]|nr:hypothetical protein [Anaerolineales bacterium]
LPTSSLLLKVRMGIHTGEAEARDGEYRGYLTLSMIQRVMSAGHGGQILLSGASEMLLRGQLPKDVSLRDMGEHKLKDVPQPARIFQVVAPDLQSEFPALRALDVFPNNLPSQLTSFIGREKEIRDVMEMLKQSRLLTLTGSGGTGKTRLSLQVASNVLEQFKDGVWLIELAPISEPALVPNTVSNVLHLRVEDSRPLMDALVDWLRDKETLFILDNCEHLIDACAQFANTILQNCRGARILASSREALGIAGEVAYRVPSLPTPNEPLDIQQLQTFDSVKLFIQRATLTLPSFQLTDENASFVAQICSRLDGIPLALELAAARVRSLSVKQIAERLDDRFRLLTGGSRAALPRQQTLRALIDWSYQLLSEDERLLFRRLAVFVGGWTLDAAESVCGEERSGFDILDLMTRLVDKSLINVEHSAGESRYRRLETIRQYAREALLNSEETAAFRNRHLEYFLTYAETAKVKLGGREQEAWLAQLETEHDNLRAALEWSLETKPEFGLRIAAALIDFWDTRGYLNEGRRWLDKTLQATASLAPDSTRVDVLLGAMAFAIRQSELDVSRKILAEGLELARTIDYKKGIARGLTAQGIVAEFFNGDLTGAEALYNEALTFYREAGDRLAIGQALGPLASCALKRYDFARSENLYSESLRLFREVENEREIAGALGNLAEVALAQRNYPQAQNFAAESLALYQALADKHGVATALRSSSIARHNRGDLAQARVESEQGAAIFRELGDRGCLLLTLAALARQLHHLGELPHAADVIREARTFLNEVGQEMIATGVFDVYGRIALAQGDLEQARKQFADGLRFQQNIKDAHFVPSLLEGLAYVMITAAEDRDAVKLLGAASALREEKGLPLMQVERAEYDQALAALKSKVDDASLQNLWNEGFAMSIEEATQFALEKSK